MFISLKKKERKKHLKIALYFAIFTGKTHEISCDYPTDDFSEWLPSIKIALWFFGATVYWNNTLCLIKFLKRLVIKLHILKNLLQRNLYKSSVFWWTFKIECASIESHTLFKGKHSTLVWLILKIITYRQVIYLYKSNKSVQLIHSQEHFCTMIWKTEFHNI